MSILFVLFSHSFRELFVRTADVCLFSSFRLLLHLSEAEHLAVGTFTFSDLKSIPVEFRIFFVVSLKDSIFICSGQITAHFSVRV
jgi:hypothetical protein